jgi:hypothetical protein
MSFSALGGLYPAMKLLLNLSEMLCFVNVLIDLYISYAAVLPLFDHRGRR